MKHSLPASIWLRRAFLFLMVVACLIVPAALHAQSPAARPGVVLVSLKDRAGQVGALAALPAGVTVAARLGGDSYLLRVPPGQEQRYVAELARLPQVEHAQLDGVVMALGEPNDPRYPEQWNLAQIGMPEAWAAARGSTPVTVAVIDSGIDLQHPDLRGQLWSNPGEVAFNGRDDDANGYVDDVHGWHFYQTYSDGQAVPRDDAVIDDANGHGTHVAGILAATGDNGQGIAGTNWGARLMIVRMLDANGFGSQSDLIRGIYYALSNGAQVINLSVGVALAGEVLRDAVVEAERQGVLLVGAAGNNGGALVYPAAYPTVLSVGATDTSNTRAPFSSYGPELDLVAPGQRILSTWTNQGYATLQGTSMAAPHVAGVAALVFSQQPDIAPAELRAYLTSTASDLNTPGWDEQTGWGLLNAAAAVGALAVPAPHVYLPFLSH